MLRPRVVTKESRSRLAGELMNWFISCMVNMYRFGSSMFGEDEEGGSVIVVLSLLMVVEWLFIRTQRLG